MKLAPILVQYLLENYELPLQGIGTFTLNQSGITAVEADKGLHRYSENALQFQYDPRVPVSQELIRFVSKSTGKIMPLATSDLESYLVTGKQLLNISKPFVIEGLGTLDRRSDESISFAPLGFLQIPVEDPANPRKRAAVVESTDAVSFDENYLKPLRKDGNSTRLILIALALLLGLGLIAWVAYYFLSQGSSDTVQEETLQPATQQIDTSTLPATDTLNMPSQDSAQMVQPDSGFVVILETLPRARAFRRYESLRTYGHKVQLQTDDSVTFRIAMPVNAPRSDTGRVKDSLTRFFGRKVSIQ